MAKVIFKRRTTAEIENLEIEDGSVIINTQNGKTYTDVGEERIQTGGNAETMINIGSETAPEDKDIKIWFPKNAIKTKASEVTNSMEDSDTLAPSVNAVKKYVENYSTEEQVIGTWINGETIYKKVYKNINVGTLNSSKYTDLLDLDSNIKGIIDIWATDTTQIFPTYESSSTFMKFKRNGTKLQIIGAGYDNWNIQIIVKYIKNEVAK